jgi:hypothetical protein
VSRQLRDPQGVVDQLMEITFCRMSPEAWFRERADDHIRAAESRKKSRL